MDIYAKQALDEYNSDTVTTRRGGNGKPFWNANATQFLYAPAFQFMRILGCDKYIFTATDEEGKEYLFTATSPTAALTPIWKEIPTGIVRLKVEADHKNTRYECGARTFFKASPFPGRKNLPMKEVSYKECALKGLRFVFNDPITRNWLVEGLPKRDYYHSVYPSKMISATVKALIVYAKLEPEHAQEAMKMAVNAADYLISITYGDGSALAGLPPTFSFKNIDRDIVRGAAPVAEKREHTVMMIYPALVGNMYLELEKATGDEKYFRMAEKIARYYQKNILPNGSWYLLVSEKTGEPETRNCCCSFEIMEFLNNFYQRTGEACWREIEKGYLSYIEKMCLDSYHWEGQFEDSEISDNHSNLSHYEADGMIRYITKRHTNDELKISVAEELMRFVEDQFVVWEEFSPLNIHYDENNDDWYAPAGIEQYFWPVPIDASTASIAKSFLSLYKATKKRIYLEKAYALGDAIAMRQNKETGVFPTHWMKKDCAENLENFWMNCHVASTLFLNELADYEMEVGK